MLNSLNRRSFSVNYHHFVSEQTSSEIHDFFTKVWFHHFSYHEASNEIFFYEVKFTITMWITIDMCRQQMDNTENLFLKIISNNRYAWLNIFFTLKRL